MVNLKRIVLILIMLISVAFTQDNSAPEPRLTRALQFKYNSGITFGGFNGSTFSYKKMETPELERRYSLTLNGSVYNQNQDEVIETHIFSPDTLYSRDEIKNDKQKQLNLSIGSCKLNHHHNIERVSLFYGWGPIVSYNYSSTERDFERVQDTLLVATFTDASTSTLSAGVQGIVGWEWRVSNIVSITAEYGSTLKMQLLNATTNAGQEDRSYRSLVNLADIKRPTIELYGGTRIGVSLYF